MEPGRQQTDERDRRQLERQWREGEKQSVLVISLLAVTKAAQGRIRVFASQCQDAVLGQVRQLELKTAGHTTVREGRDMNSAYVVGKRRQSSGNQAKAGEVSLLKSTAALADNPPIESQHPPEGSQPPGPGEAMPSSTFFRHQGHHGTQTHICTYNKEINFKHKQTLQL